MWILLMIVFINPYEIQEIKLLGKYTTKLKCASEVQRALSIKTTQKISFGCIRIEENDISKGTLKKES